MKKNIHTTAEELRELYGDNDLFAQAKELEKPTKKKKAYRTLLTDGFLFAEIIEAKEGAVVTTKFSSGKVCGGSFYDVCDYGTPAKARKEAIRNLRGFRMLERGPVELCPGGFSREERRDTCNFQKK